jgi:inhibitor of cysteine peptidase
MVQNQIRKKAPIYGLTGILAAIILVAMIYSYGAAPQISPNPSPMVINTPNPSPSPLLSSSPPTGTLPAVNPEVSPIQMFHSYTEIQNFLQNNTNGGNRYVITTGEGFTTNAQTPSAVPSPVPSPASASSISGTIGQITTTGKDSTSTTYSPTNIQVAGVDEADSVKTDGKYLYLIANNTVYIMDAGASNPHEAKVIAKIASDDSNNGYLSGIYLSQDGNKLALLGNLYTPYITTTKDSFIMPPYWGGSTTFVQIYDVTNKAIPVLARNFTMSGNYFNSRMIGNYVYTIVTESVNMGSNGTFNLPIVFAGAEVSNIAPNRILYVPSEAGYYTYTTVVALNILDDSQAPANTTVMMGGTSEMYVSANNIYITTPTWYQNNQNTNIYRISINQTAMTVAAKGSVVGSPINQYAMDEYNGYFRLATTTWIQDNATTSDGTVFQVSRQVNSIYVLNADMNVVGKLEKFKMDENLYAARFMGSKCYVVTAKQTDPFFIIDMSNPAAPKVAGQLKIPGYSSFLYPLDETHIIGLGKENSTLKLSLFDVSNVNAPTEIAKYMVNASYSDSSALYDPHAFLFDAAKQMLVIPVSINDQPVIMPLLPESKGEVGIAAPRTLSYWQGAYIFNVNATSGFTLKGSVTQVDSTTTQNNDYYWTTSSYWINRSLYIDNTVYTFSQSRVQLNSLTDFAMLAKIDLN